MRRATNKNIQDVMIDAVMKLAIDTFKYSGINIKKAPEYLINVAISLKLAKAFPALGFKLEKSYAQLAKELDIQDFYDFDLFGGRKRADILLTSRGSGKPRHVVEVKRSNKVSLLEKDLLRISALSRELHNEIRLDTGFLVVLIEAHSLDKVLELTDDRCERFEDLLGGAYNVTYRYNYLKTNKAGFVNGKFLFTVVYSVSPKI